MLFASILVVARAVLAMGKPGGHYNPILGAAADRGCI